MTLDDLRSPWQATNRESLSPEKREELVARVCRQVERLGATIFRRDAVETIAAVAVIFFFSFVFLRLPNLVAKLGAAVIVLSACYIVYKLHHTRMDRSPSPLDVSVRDFCKIEIERMDRQIHLLQSVLWWYIGPLMIGVNLVQFGIDGVGVGSMVYCVFTLFFGWWVHVINQKSVVKSLVPMRDELSDLFRELDEAT